MSSAKWCRSLFYVVTSNKLLNKRLSHRWLETPWSSCGTPDKFNAVFVNKKVSFNAKYLSNDITSTRIDDNQHCFNSLWPNDTIWRHRLVNTVFYVLLVWYYEMLCQKWRNKTVKSLTQVMACCLTAPSHYPNQCWLIISNVLRHLSDALSYKDLKISINKTRLKIEFLKAHPNLPGANKLRWWLCTECATRHYLN